MEEMLAFLEDFRDRVHKNYYCYRETNLRSSAFYQHGSEAQRAFLRELFNSRDQRCKINGPDFGAIKHYDVEALTDNFAGEKLIRTTLYGRLFRAKIPADDGVRIREVTVKTWDFSFPPTSRSIHAIDKFYGECKVLISEEMGSQKNLLNIIGYSCEKHLALVYDAQLLGQSVRDATISNSFDWNARIGVAVEIARLVEFMHSKQHAVGTIHGKNIAIDKEGNYKLVEFGLHALEWGPQDPMSYFLESYGHYAPEIRSGIFSIKTDVFAYGILVWELICRRLFETKEIICLGEKIGVAGSSFVDSSFSVDEKVGKEMTKLVLNCLDKDPTKRPDMEEIANNIEKLCGPLLHPKKKQKMDNE